ncbi:MAG TPA: LemA family protein [Candidatus Nanoarchaeia archaeon]|nr:LemA family protein [Candidatus Nanoarchaeia archaeon]
MDQTMILIGIAAFALLIAVAYAISTRNGIVANKNNVLRAWADVIAYQRKKLNVIPELERGIREHLEFEQGLLTNITSIRSMVSNLSDKAIEPGHLQAIEAKTKELLAGIRIAVENYPQLRTTELYSRWMNALEEIEDNIAAAITVFNAAVERFNNCIQQFPANVVNSWLNQEAVLQAFTDTRAASGIEYKPGFSA